MPCVTRGKAVVHIGDHMINPGEALYRADCVAKAAKRCNAGCKVRLSKWSLPGGEVAASAALKLAKEIFSIACDMLAEEAEQREAAEAALAEGQANMPTEAK